MTRVHGVQINLNSEEEAKLERAVGSSFRNNNNLRKDVNFHISIYICSLPAGRVKPFIKCLEKLAPTLTPINVEIRGPYKLDEHYIEFKAKSKELHALHAKLLSTIEPLVNGAFNPKYLKLELSVKQKLYLNKYGYHRIKEYYDPHITLGKYENQDIRDSEIKLIKKTVIKLKFTKITFNSIIDNEASSAKLLWTHNFQAN